MTLGWWSWLIPHITWGAGGADWINRGVEVAGARELEREALAKEAAVIIDLRRRVEATIELRLFN